MQKYFNFNGLASRSEYWGVLIIATILGTVLGVFSGFFMGFGDSTGSGFSILFGIIGLLATIVATTWATLATCVRRCRDAGINVWWTLGAVVPYVGWIIAIVIGCLKSDEQ